jgi:hypothetical protein
MIKEIVYKVDVNTLERHPDGKELRMNEIGRVQLRTTKPLYYDSYRKNRTTGSIILIEEGTFQYCRCRHDRLKTHPPAPSLFQREGVPKAGVSLS